MMQWEANTPVYIAKVPRLEDAVWTRVAGQPRIRGKYEHGFTSSGQNTPFSHIVLAQNTPIALGHVHEPSSTNHRFCQASQCSAR